MTRPKIKYVVLNTTNLAIFTSSNLSDKVPQIIQQG